MYKVFKLKQKRNKRSFVCIVILFLFFLNATVFGQTKVLEVSTTEQLLMNECKFENSAKVSSSVLNSNVNFILWFMGTKESMDKTFYDVDLYSRKSFKISGREPNHLLVKTLLKKALNNASS
jgi:hypothetical protein